MLLVFVLSACAKQQQASTPTREYTYQEYYQAAFYAQQTGAWAEARGYFSVAIKKAQAANADDATLAILFYEYGRTSGVVCQWQQAEKALAKAYALDELSNGPVYMSLYELAQLYDYRKDWTKAESFYRRTYDAAKQYQLATQNPREYASFLDGYARLLERFDQPDQAARLQEQAQLVRELLVNEQSRDQAVTALTPYGKEC